MKRLLVVVAAAGLLTLGGAGVAAAQTGGGTTPTTPPPGPTHHRARLALGLLRVSAQTLGVQPRDVVTGLCSGQTLAQVASAHGKTPQDLIDALVNAADQRIQARLQAGRITPAQATQRLSKVNAAVPRLVDSYHVPAQRCERLQGGAGATTPTTGST